MENESPQFNPDYQEPTLDNQNGDGQLSVLQISGTIPTVSALPTYTPKKFSDQFRVGSSTFYVYDTTNHVWISLTIPVAVTKQVFTATGTWTKPTGCTTVQVVCVGAGGSGGSGRKGAAGTVRGGGFGGGGAAVSVATFNASDLGATETVTVAATTTGGTSQTTNSTDGTGGNDGTSSSFGTWLKAGGGGRGLGGNASTGAGAGGGGVIGDASSSTGGLPRITGTTVVNAIGGQGPEGGTATNVGNVAEWGGGSSSGSNGNGAFNASGSSIYGGGAGGGGGGIGSGNNYVNPIDGGAVQSYTQGGGGSFGPSADTPTVGGPGLSNAANKKGYGSPGGGGGGSSKTQNAAVGGAGGIPGGGGGGGGASLDAVGNSGAGGDGGRGEVRVYAW